MSRPRKYLDLPTAQQLALKGLPVAVIARGLEVSQDTLHRRAKEDPAFAEVLWIARFERGARRVLRMFHP